MRLVAALERGDRRVRGHGGLGRRGGPAARRRRAVPGGGRLSGKTSFWFGLWLPLVAGWEPLTQLPPPLEPGPERALVGRIAPGERQVLRLEIEGEFSSRAGQVLRINAEQNGADLLIEVADPEGNLLARADSPTGAHGREILAFRPSTSGQHRLFLRAFGAIGGRAGSYRIERTDLAGEGDSGGSRAEGALALGRAGELYAEGDRESLVRAAVEAEAAAAAFGRVDDGKDRRTALAFAASLSELVERPAEAAELWRGALVLAERDGETAAVAEAENRLGLLDWQAGHGERARGRFERALLFARAAEDATAEARALNNLGLVEQGEGALAAALDRYERAATRFATAGDAAESARAAGNAAGIAARLGEPRQALAGYERALSELNAAGDRAGAARAAANAGGVLLTLGELDAAIGRYGEALAAFRSAGDRRGEGSAWNSLGAAYLGLGEPLRAAGLLRRALELRRASGDARGEAATLQLLGLAEAELGDPAAAEKRLDEALSLRVRLGDRLGQAATLEELALRRIERTAPGGREALLAALDRLDRALALRGQPGHAREDPAGRGRARVARGRVLRALGRGAEGTAEIERGREDLAAGQDRGGEARALVALARAAAEDGREKAAASWLERAFARLEDLRGRAGLPELRAGFLAARREGYELALELELARHEREPRGGHDRMAFFASERGRARTLLDRRAGAGISVRDSPLDPRLENRRRQMGERIAAKELRRLALVAEGGAEDSVRALAAEIESELVDLQLLEAEIARGAPLSAVARIATVEEMQALLEPGELLLEVALGEARSALFAVERETFALFLLPGRREIEAAAAEVLAGWGSIGPDPETGGRAGAELSRLLLGPIAARLGAAGGGEPEGRRSVLIVPDGALHSLPWPALSAPGSESGDAPLAARARVALLPSASYLAVARREAREDRPLRRIAVLADPVFDLGDPRLGGRGGVGATRGGGSSEATEPAAFDRLPSSAREAESIAAAASGGLAEVVLALGLSARRERVLGGELSGYDVLHFATHGVDHPERPELSALALSQVDEAGLPTAGLLRASDLSGIALGARLVVLSGCRTARGREVAGEGPRGLARAFLDAGAGAVVASLWPVPDRATAELMAAFYRGLLAERLSPAASLARAQLEVRARREFRHPFYWAAFVLIGDIGTGAETR